MAKIISSLTNPLVKHLVHLRADADYRQEQKLVLVEGRKLIAELGTLHTIVTTDLQLIPEGCQAAEVFLASESVLHKISATKNPEGIVGEVDMPAESRLKGVERLLALDGISDPGNLGTLLRTACAFGWGGIFLLPNCCDLFNDKALRAAKGTTFKIPYRKGDWEALKKLAVSEQLTPLAADLEGKSPEKFANAAKVLLVIGSEAKGLSAQAKKFCTSITLAMAKNSVESLNAAVAGALLLYLLKKEGR